MESVYFAKCETSTEKFLDLFQKCLSELNRESIEFLLFYQWILRNKHSSLIFREYDSLFAHAIKNSKILISKDLKVYSLKKKENFFTFEELVIQKFGRSQEEFFNSKKQDWKELYTFLISDKGVSKFKLPEKLFFLDPVTIPFKILQASVSRCGSNFLRSLIERILWFPITYNIEDVFDYTIMVQSLLCGSEAHGGYGFGSWIDKSGFPNWIESRNPSAYHKIYIPIRNPIDVIASDFSADYACHHELILKPTNYNEAFPEEWNLFMKSELSIFLDFYKFWVDARDKLGLPVLFVRYEDLVLGKIPTLRHVIKFILGIKETARTVVEERLLQEMNSNHQLYEVKPGGIYKHKSFYNEEQFKYVIEQSSQMLSDLGYFQEDGKTLKTEEELAQEALSGKFYIGQESQIERAILQMKDVEEGKTLNSILINDPQYDLRSWPTPEFPNGRGNIDVSNVFLNCYL